MRISTGQMFQQSTNSILEKQSATNSIMGQISSGKRVETAGDDPVAAIAIDNLKQKNTLVEQYEKNIDYATNHLAISESKIGSTETLIASMREQLLRGANGSLSSNERQMIADEMKQSLEELLSIANSQDESGNYMFAGTKTNDQPFAFDASGEIVYSGDSGIRKSVVASGIAMTTNIPGDTAFMNAANPLGDYGVNYLSSQQGEFNLSSAKITDETSHVADTYTFNFIANGAGVDLQVVDSAGTVATTVTNFDATSSVSFNGIEVKLTGTPEAGDSFTIEPKENVSIFDAFNQAIAFLESSDATTTAQSKSQLAQLLNDIDSGQNQVSTARSIAGNNLKGLESISSNHSEEKIINSSALSMLEDLDLAEAITEFEKQQLALNAVSSVFSTVGSLSLFDYI
ncbi:flagellar hook-associated protein FlgL [Shewanella saliphila]|uniref:Flagellar hook-associated protein FlgL n=1 Tax=Shewanella saliphila TaxID=2282698 RepID=A0ABQ2Q419_9GAMM|nr:flagellar hook-associated protein FlgL [Shewanella saliphila]MCL1099795.1 flagellar hook-associated protein FlgL [Shewanella saliphila]GGP45152.1 flagellar hook-associated protein FlgL [Shewanella saliphila]